MGVGAYLQRSNGEIPLSAGRRAAVFFAGLYFAGRGLLTCACCQVAGCLQGAERQKPGSNCSQSVQETHRTEARRAAMRTVQVPVRADANCGRGTAMLGGQTESAG